MRVQLRVRVPWVWLCCQLESSPAASVQSEKYADQATVFCTPESCSACDNPKRRLPLCRGIDKVASWVGGGATATAQAKSVGWWMTETACVMGWIGMDAI